MVMAYFAAAPIALSLLSAGSLSAGSLSAVPALEGFSQESVAQGAIVVSQQTSQQTGNQQTRAATSTSAMEQAVFQQINEYRRQKGLSALTLNATITQQARSHSQNMARSRVLSHDGFSARVQTISKSIAYRAAAENVAYNMGFTNPDVQAVQGWIKSAGHRQNIEGRYGLTGIGVAKNSQGEYYFTQIFIRQ
jgi:uncharacterized protein YkwD